MKRFLMLVALLLLVANVSSAQQQPMAGGASEASIKELLTLTKARAMVDGMLPQLEGMLRNTMQQSLQGQKASIEQQAVFDKFLGKVIGIYKQEMSWEKMQPLYLKIYRASFSQAEVDGMLAFYKSPSGKAVIEKMPLVMQNSMSEMQKMMGPMMQLIQKSAAEMEQELRATQPKK